MMELQKVYKVVDVSIASYGVANILIANGETKVVEPTEAILLTKEDACWIETILNKAKSALQYAAFNYDGTKEEDVIKGLLDSTGVSETAIISVREINEALQILNK